MSANMIFYAVAALAIPMLFIAYLVAQGLGPAQAAQVSSMRVVSAVTGGVELIILLLVAAPEFTVDLSVGADVLLKGLIIVAAALLMLMTWATTFDRA